MTARSIDEVIDFLTTIIAWSKQNESRLGYFPALYRKVTIAVKEGIAEGLFEDGARMESLDVFFANRYLEAVETYQSGQLPTRSWQLTFEATQSRQYVVLQHLLLGINTHINLDLGIAAAETMRGSDIHVLENDFKKINEILSSMVGEVMEELGAVSPLLKQFDLLAGSIDEYLTRFGIEIAREHAWQVALHFSKARVDTWPNMIESLDDQIAHIAEKIRKPGRWLRFLLFLVRIPEWKSARRIIEVLE